MGRSPSTARLSSAPPRRKEEQTAMPADALKCKECDTTYALEARFVCERCFGPLEVRYSAPNEDAAELKRRIQAGPLNLWRYADFLPLDRGVPAQLAAHRLHAAGARRPPRRAPRPARGVGQERDRQPDALVQGPRRVRRARPRARARASRRSPAPRRATWPTPSRPTRPRPACRPTSSSRPTSSRRRSSPRAPTGPTWSACAATTTTSTASARELAGEHESWAFVNINMRPYYAEGSKTLAFEVVEQLGWEAPDRIVGPIASGSLFTKVARGFDEFRDAGLARRGDDPIFNGAQAEGCSPVAQAYAAGRDFCTPGQAGHDRQVARDRQPRRRPVRDRARPRTGGAHRRGVRRRDPRGRPPARGDDRHLHGDRRRRHHRDAGQARRARRHRPRRARRAADHGRRPQDHRHRARDVRRRRDRPDGRLLRRRLRRRARPPDGVTVKIPTQLRAVTGGAAEATRGGRDGRRGARVALRGSTASCATASPARTASCAASSTSTWPGRTSASSTASRRPSPTAPS